MIEIVRSETFNRWLRGLSDRRAAARISQRLSRVANGLLGDVRSVGEGVSEMRIHYGPGYRLYYVREDETIIVLLCGGDKSSQRRDTERAKQMARARERETKQ